jgi:hypothetical protein
LAPSGVDMVAAEGLLIDAVASAMGFAAEQKLAAQAVTSELALGEEENGPLDAELGAATAVPCSVDEQPARTSEAVTTARPAVVA